LEDLPRFPTAFEGFTCLILSFNAKVALNDLGGCVILAFNLDDFTFLLRARGACVIGAAVVSFGLFESTKVSWANIVRCDILGGWRMRLAAVG
jgi:hypothetical protein